MQTVRSPRPSPNIRSEKQKNRTIHQKQDHPRGAPGWYSLELALQGVFSKAQNILNKMPGQKELVKESEAEAFAEELQREVEFHKAH